MNELSISNEVQTRHICNFTCYLFNAPLRASVVGGTSSHNSLALPSHVAHQPWSHVAVGWHSILQPGFIQVSLCGCVSHSNTFNMSKLIPQVYNPVEVWTFGRLFYSLYSYILDVVCDNPGYVGAKLSSWRIDLILISYCI